MYFNDKYRFIIQIIKILSELIDFRKKEKQIDLTSIKSVVIVDFQQIGDIIVSTGLIRDLKKQHPHLEITIIGLPFIEEILASDFNISNIEYVKGGWLERFKTAYKIKSKFDLSICPRGDVRDIFIGRILSKKYVLSFDFSGGDFLLDLVPDYGEMSHISHRQLQIGKFLRIYNHHFKYTYKLQLKTAPMRVYEEEIAIHIGSSRRLRQLPETELIPIIDFLIELGKPITFFNSPGLVDGLVDRIGARYKDYKFKIWNGSLKDFVNELSRYSVLVTTDSAQAHMTAGWGLKTFVVYGPSSLKFSYPIGEKVINIKKENVLCAPCTQYRCINKVHQYCYSDIHKQVINELEMLL